MTFSYLRAIAQRKKFGSTIVNFIVITILDIFLVFSLFSVNPTVLNLQVVYLVVQMIMSALIFIAGVFAEAVFKKHIEQKNYKQIIDNVVLYNFREKYGWLSNIFSLLSNALAVYVMVSLGWVWQPILFVFTTYIGLSSLYSFIEDLPNQVAKSSLQEEDFYGYY